MQHQSAAPSWVVEVTAARGGPPLSVISRLSRLQALNLARKVSVHGVRAHDGSTYAPTKIFITVGRAELFGGAA